MATARCSSPASSPETNGTMSSANPRSRTPSSIALSTMPIGWNWTGRPCANSKPQSRPKLMLDHPQRKPPGPSLRQSSQQKGIRNDRRAQLPARPGGSTGTSRARRCASREGAPRHARVPPIDYRDGLSPCLTSHQETDITTPSSNGAVSTRATLVAIDRNRWSRSSECPVARPQERKFLGFSFTAGPDIKRTIAPKSLERFKQRIREITRRAKGVSIKTTMEELATYMRGWRGYFGFCETPEVLIALTRWVRLRLRAALWRQWKTPRRRRAALIANGVSEWAARNTAGSGRGPWYLARSRAISTGLSNAYFKSLGLPSLFQSC